jgi:hypothetical protein
MNVVSHAVWFHDLRAPTFEYLGDTTASLGEEFENAFSRAHQYFVRVYGFEHRTPLVFFSQHREMLIENYIAFYSIPGEGADDIRENQWQATAELSRGSERSMSTSGSMNPACSSRAI